MRILTLARKDIKQIFQSPQSTIFLLIMPVAFTLMFGFMFGGFGGQEEDTRLPIVVLDQDQTSLSAAYVEQLDQSDVIRPVVDDGADEAELRQAVSNGDYAGALLIPVGFDEQLSAGEPSLMTLVTADNTTTPVEISIKNALMSAYSRLFNAALAASISADTYEAQVGADASGEIYDESLDLALDAWENPPIKIVQTFTGSESEEEPLPIETNAFVHSSPGMMAQFAIAGLIGAAEILVTEKRSRSLQRMLTTGMSRASILLGHFTAMSTVIFLQLLILAVFGQLFLQLDYFGRPLATLLILIASSTATGAMGLLIGALAKTSETAVVFSLIPMFLFSGLGGAWTPLEYTSETVQAIAKFTPVAWTINALKDILGRGLGLEAVWLAVLVLLGFTALFFGLAAWAFKFE